MRHLLLALASAVLTAPLVWGAASPAGPRPLPKHVTGAWEKAGARIGWAAIDVPGRIDRECVTFRELPAGKPGDIPAIYWVSSRAKAVAGLPVPTQPFALLCPAPDDELFKVLGRAPHLRAVQVGEWFVRNEGVRHLANFPGLRAVDMPFAWARDVDVRRLTGLTELRSLNVL